jgi:hypothetical protein
MERGRPRAARRRGSVCRVHTGSCTKIGWGRYVLIIECIQIFSDLPSRRVLGHIAAEGILRDAVLECHPKQFRSFPCAPKVRARCILPTAATFGCHQHTGLSIRRSIPSPAPDPSIGILNGDIVGGANWHRIRKNCRIIVIYSIIMHITILPLPPS